MVNPPTYVRGDLSADRFPGLTKCLDIWEEKRGNRFAPKWRDLDFFAFPLEMIPYLYLVDIHADPLDFRYRFMGTAICEVEGRDYTGLSVDDVQPPELAPAIRKQFEAFTNDPKPTFFMIQEQTPDWSKGSQKIYGGLRLPLSSDGITMDQFVVIGQFEREQRELEEYFNELISSYENKPPRAQGW